MYDKQLVFFSEKSLTAAVTSDVIDMGTKLVTTGQKPLFLVITPTEDVAADTATVKFNLQSSDDNATFTTIATTGAITGAKFKKTIAIPLPVHSGRYLRVTTEVSTTAPSAGNATAYLFDKFTDPCVKLMEGVE